jgi:hypothetical protein
MFQKGKWDISEKIAARILAKKRLSATETK